MSTTPGDFTTAIDADTLAARLTVRYMIGLALIAAVAVTGGLVLRLAQQNATGNARQMNIAGRQRMLSQKLGKEALGHDLAQFRGTLELFESAHRGLRVSIRDEGFTGPSTPLATQLFADLEPSYDRLVDSSRALLAASGGDASDPLRSATESRLTSEILAAAPAFLAGMDAIVNEYQRDAEADLDLGKYLSETLLVTLILVVLLIGALTFRPAVRMARESMAELARSKQGVEREKSYVELLEVAASSANKASSVEEAIAFCLDRVCAHTGWPVGHAYVRAPDGSDVLVPSACWHLDDPERFEAFRDVTNRTRLARGVGLPGRVLATGRAEWIVDVTVDPNFPRAQPAIDIGVRAGFAFPVCTGGEVVAVLEFFSPSPAPPDPRLLSVMEHIGQQLGRLIERTRITQSLIESQRRLAEAQQISHIGSWTWNLASNAVTWSDEEYRLLGVEAGGFQPSYEAYLNLVHPDDRALATATISSALQSGKPFDHRQRIVCRDGAERVIRARGALILDDAGTPVLMSGTTEDVTDQAAAEAAMRKADERFQLVARATNDAVWDWDIPSSAVWWNDGFYELFGYGKHDIPLTLDFWLGRIHADDAERVGHSIEQFLASDEEIWSGEYRFRRADGDYAWVHDRGYVVRSSAGVPHRMLGSMMDVTARKEVDGMKADFVAFVSHQLRTPLSGMKWMLELASDVPALPDDARGYVAEAQESAQRLVSLVNDLLDVSRHETGEMDVTLEAVRLQTLTHSVLNEMRSLIAAKTHRLVLDLPPSAAPVTADPQLLRQAILNLVSNAIKYTPAGGTIGIAVAQHGGSVRWAVTDTGVGIAKASQRRLFEKFYRADNALSVATEGTGLGLHLVRLIIRRFGGDVACQSDEGQGAEFSFELPVADVADVAEVAKAV